jgi:hypothetical protein
MRAPFLILGAALLVAGCGTTADCGSDWYTKGWSDGRYGAFAQADGPPLAACDRMTGRHIRTLPIVARLAYH